MMNHETNYNYPMLNGWSTTDIIAVSALYSAVAAAYEGGVDRNQLQSAYRGFKEVVPSKAEEKQLDREFGAVSGYSIYRTMQAATKQSTARIKMEA